MAGQCGADCGSHQKVEALSFPASWLDLREPYDLAARNGGLRELFLENMRSAGEARIIDLGGGTGSTARAIADGKPLRWLIVENDRQLVAEGRKRHPQFEYRVADLSVGLEAAVPEDAKAITASALIDLVSGEWLKRLANLAARRRLPLYIALTYDGRMRWRPGDLYDAEIKRMFDCHQGRDKGFGPALGPGAVDALKHLLKSHGGAIHQAPSDWQFSPGDKDIQHALLQGYRSAALEIAPTQEGEIEGWTEARKARLDADQSRHMVGHQDLFWLPPD